MARSHTTPTEGASVLGPQVAHVDDKPADDDVLIYNSRGGVYQAHATRTNPTLSSDRQARIEVRTLRLLPGLNFAARDLWNTLRGQPGPRERVAEGMLIDVADFAALSDRLASEYVRNTGSVPTLERLLAVEARDKVAEAIRKQIAACSEGPAPQSARLRQVHAGAGR